MKTIRILLKHFKKYMWLFCVTMFCIIGYTVLNGVSIISVIPLMDKVLGGKNIVLPAHSMIPFRDTLTAWAAYLNSFTRFELLVSVCTFIIVAFSIKAVFQFFQKYLMEKICFSLIRDLRVEIYTKLQELSVAYFSSHKTGDLMSRIQHDVEVIRHNCTVIISDIFTETAQLCMYICMIVMLDPVLSIVVVLSFLFLVFPMHFIAKRLRQINIKAQRKIADINACMMETFIGIHIVKAFSMEEYEKRKFEHENTIYTKLLMKSVKREAFISPMIECLAIFSAILIILYGSWKVIYGQTTFSAFVLVIALMAALLKPIRRVTKLLGSMQKASAAVKRLDEIFNEIPSIQEPIYPKRIISFQQRIIFDAVSFGYLPYKPVLRSISFEIKKGQVVALVGPSGSGKTTLAHLLLRFYDPQEGRILIDGINIRELQIMSLRNLMGLVTQDIVLFNDTIRNNIAYGIQSMHIEVVKQAARAANADEFIQHMKDKYETHIGERGIQLSGGQKQRLTIARALLKNPPILILDEATSSLDTESERAVQEAIDRLMEGRTVFVIAHRLSTIQNADTILVLDNGAIIQQGTHDTLIATDGLYKKLYEMQFVQTHTPR